jgi:hypothetical protein
MPKNECRRRHYPRSRGHAEKEDRSGRRVVRFLADVSRAQDCQAIAEHCFKTYAGSIFFIITWELCNLTSAILEVDGLGFVNEINLKACFILAGLSFTC